MTSGEERPALAERHVVAGRRIIEAKHQLIARKKGYGFDTSDAEIWLCQFLQAQEIFEYDLAKISIQMKRPVFTPR